MLDNRKNYGYNMGAIIKKEKKLWLQTESEELQA